MPRKHEVWLKPVGTGDAPLEDRWLEHRSDLLRHVRFPQQPSGIRSGDLLVYYAAGKQRLFAVARASQNGSDASFEMVDNKARWPYKLSVQVFVLIPDLRLAPSFDVLDIPPHSISQK